MASPDDLSSLVVRLAEARIEFVLVGGLAAVAQGAPLTTHDVDIVHRREPENVDRLLALLTSLNARYRGRPRGADLRPSSTILLGSGHSLLMTDLGPLDVLGAIEGGRAYEDLLDHAVELDVAGHPVRVLSLAAIADLKRGSNHPKDRYVLAILDETLRRTRQR